MNKLSKNFVKRDQILQKSIKLLEKRGLCFDMPEEICNLISNKFENLAFKGNCFFCAFVLANEMKNCNLIYGKLNKLNVNQNDEYVEVFHHGWVEKDGFVFDTTMKKIFDRKAYREMFEVEAEKTFSSQSLKSEKVFMEAGLKAVKPRPELLKLLLEFSKQRNKQNSKTQKQKELVF